MVNHKYRQILYIFYVFNLLFSCQQKSSKIDVRGSNSPGQKTDSEVTPDEQNQANPDNTSPINQNQQPTCVHDCSQMVYIPAGTFSMGADGVPGESRPKHQVTLSKGFWLDKYEVSQKNYAKCLNSGVCPKPEGSFDPNIDRAVYGVPWISAQAYCNWTGKRLATEAEWERAACGTGDQCYPWGGDKIGESDCSEKPDCNKAAHCLQSGCVGGPCYEKPKSILDFEAAGNVSPYGIVNQAGNVWEWVQDNWTDNFEWCSSGCTDPLAPSSNSNHVMKGGSWISEEVFLRCAARYHDGQGGFPSFEVGIRCAADAN